MPAGGESVPVSPMKLIMGRKINATFFGGQFSHIAINVKEEGYWKDRLLFEVNHGMAVFPQMLVF